MKKQSRNTRGPGAWFLGGVASLLMCVSAFGQYVATQPTPITIPDSGTGTPYPSSIDLTKSNITGVIEKVSVTVNGLTHPSAPDLGFLLVGPNSKAVVLLSGSGASSSGNAALNNATFTFTDDATGGAPANSPLVSGSSYKPTDNASLAFLPPAPTSGYVIKLGDAFTNSDPNGIWKLYVLDTTAGPGGGPSPVLGSWSLNLFTTPSFTIVTNASTVESTTHQITTTVPENGSVGVGLVLQSSSTPVANLTVSATKIPTLVTNFSTSGTDQNRTLTITPNALTFGTNTLTITIDDGIAKVTTNITLAVTHVNQAPTIALSTNTVTTVSGFMTTNIIIATVADADINFDANAVAKLNLTATSSDPSIVSSNGVFFSAFTPGGDKRTVTVVPAGSGTGTATVTVKVDDGALTNSASFTVTVLPVGYSVFANNATISAAAAASGNSTIVIPANTVPGLVGSASIFVNGWKGVTPASTTFTLTPPGGAPITLFANSGSSSPQNYGQVFFVDGGGASLPASDDLTNTISLAAPVTLGGTSGVLSGVNPNGTWTLTVQNSGATAAQIVDGWTLNILPAPTVGNIADIRGPEESTQIATFTVGAVNGTVTNVTGRVVGNAGLAKITGSVNGNNGTLTIVGNFNQFGTNTVEVRAEDNHGFFGTNTFTLALFFVDHAPVVQVIPRQVVPAGGVLGPLAFAVSDVDTPLTGVTVRANSSDQKFLPDANILLLPTGGAGSGTYTLTLFPIGAVSGSVNVTITANDGTLSGTSTFNVFIQDPANPLFVSPNSIVINANGPGAPYGSTNNVSGLIGKVQKVSVSLFGISAPSPGNAQFLLVGPTGASVLLMNGSGGNNALTGTVLVFDDSSAASLPSSGQIISGIYKPTQNGTVTSLPGPAPGTPYGTDFTGFKTTNPNGNWALYVADNGSAKGGIISGGWTLSIQTAPSIPTIKDQFTPENVTARITITVGDNQPGVGLNVVATGDPTLFQAPIAVSGSGATRTLTIVPVPFKVGTNVITVTATDTNTGNFSTQTFNMGVQAVAQPPLFVTTPADQTVPAATQLPPVSFQVWPPQGSPLTVTASSTDNPTLLPSIDITKTGTVNGTTNVYSLTLIPAGVLTGTGTVAIVATDTNGLKTTANFKVVVTQTLAFANTNTITIPEGLPAVGISSPYPSLVSVKGLGGLISSVQVALVGFTHAHPEDVDVLLVSPDRSKSVILMGKAGSGGAVTDLRLTFADGAPATQIPQTGLLTDGTYAPADYSSGLTLPSPATTRPYTTTLSSFNGLSPNGDWQLYVLDDTFPTGGSIDNGWVLFFKTAPAIAPLGPVTIPENTQVAVPLLLSDATVDETNLVVTVAGSLESVPDLATNLVLTGTGANRTLTITPTTNLPSAYNAQHSLTNLAGTNVITVTAKDPINNLTTVSSFVLKVLYVNQSPTITTATNGVYVDENTFKSIDYTVGDVDSIMDRSNIVVTSSDQSMLANSNIVVTGSAIAAGATGTISVKVTPTKNTHGSLTLSFVGSDTNTFTTNLVTLNINHIWQQPTITSIPAESAVAGSSTTNIAFTVGSVEVSTKNLLVFAKSDNPALVPNSPANIVFSGSGDSRFIQLFTIGSISGTANITVFVTDNSGNANSTNSTAFTLTATSVANSFANTTPITTAGAGKANIYPSPINVSGLVGATFKVSAILPNFNHSAPANLDVLLVGNKTNAVVLMSGVGGTNAASNLRLVFDESGVPLPSGSLSSAIYLPGNATGSKLVLPSPAPTNTIWSATLSAAFAGKDPNGLWELYVNDRGAGDVGNIATGWQLVIQTAPTIALGAGTASPLVFPENTTKQVNLNIGDSAIDISNLVVSATSDNVVLLPVRNITFSSNPSGHSGTVVATLAPAALQNGGANVIFTVTRSDGATSSVKLPISVTPVNVPSTVSRLDPISMPENGSNNVVFLVHDDDTPLGNLIVQATTGAGDQGLIPNANLSFNGLNTNRLVGLPGSGAPGTSLLSLGITPKLFQSGTATVTITVTDPGPAGTNTITTNFTVTVNIVIFPPFFISAPGPQSVAAGGTIANIPFAVAHPVDAASTLTMTGASSDQNLVKDSDIKFGGTGTNRTVSVTSQNTKGGTATITLKVTDPATANNFATTNFALTVRPSRTHNYTNSTIINIIDNAVADLYPSQININDLGGPIAKITATLNGFTHTFPSDVGVLLVGPTGQKIVLMSNVGGGHPGASNLQLTFDQDASGTIPASGPIAAGSFTPVDNSGGLRTFKSPAPGIPYTNTLNGFNGTNGNGTWSLYVEDFSPPDAGAISNGWSLAITTLPVINGLTDITVDENTAARQNFTVSDDTPSTPTFTFSAASDNQSVVTNAGVVFTGSGTNWTVTVNPVVNVSGSANITVTMVNGDGQTVTSKFKATFRPVAYPPDLLPIADRSTAAGALATVPLIFGNIGYSQSWLTVTFGSSNTNLVPVGNMKLSGTNLLISPLGVQQGTATITVTVANTNTPPQSTNQSFKLNVLPNPVPVFAASGAIVINDNAAATPYPSTITVAGLTGRTVASVTASLVGFGHQFPSDVSVLLVGPQGQKVVLMSRAGGSSAVTNTRLTFDDSAPAALPQFALITDGTFKPTDYKVSDTFFSPAPVAPYSHALNVFNGTDPNGDWKLYVQDDQQQETGVITSGWVLAITTSGPSISSPGPTTIVENSVSNIINFSVSSPTVNASNLIVTATNTADSPKGIISTLTLGGSGSSRFLVVTPGLNLPSLVTTNDGTSTITLTVSDGSATNSTSFPLTVSYVNQLPTMNPSVLQNLTTPANVPISTSFNLADVDTPVSNLVVSATTTVPGLGTATVSTVGSNSTVAYTPKGFVGTNIVKITVQDGGNSISNGFVVVTTASLPPTLAAIAPQSTPGAPTNTTKTVTLNVSPATGIPGFTFTGTTTNHALVSSVTFTTNANSVVANLNIVGAMVGFDFVTITVSDKNTNSTKSFPLTVTPTGVVTLAPIVAQSTLINVAKQVLLTASSPDTAVNNLHFTGSSTNSFLVSGFSFAYNGRNMIATINLINNRIGKDFVTISTTDGFSTASQSFVLTVTGTPTNSAPQLTLSASGGKLTLNLQGSPNTGYTIQGAASLAQPITWGTITNLTADATGRASFTATPAAGVPVQFIRAKSP